MTHILFFLTGSLVGFLLAFTFSKHFKPFRDLQKKLSIKEAEYHDYQNKVAAHFQKTADLFAEIQVRQDILVTHLQEGTKQLRGGMLSTHDTVAISGYDPTIPRDYPARLDG